MSSYILYSAQKKQTNIINPAHDTWVIKYSKKISRTIYSKHETVKKKDDNIKRFSASIPTSLHMFDLVTHCKCIER